MNRNASPPAVPRTSTGCAVRRRVPAGSSHRTAAVHRA